MFPRPTLTRGLPVRDGVWRVRASDRRAVYRLDVSRAKPPGVIWIGEVLVSAPVAAKIRVNHGLDPDEVGRLASSPPPRLGTLVRDQRGTRLYLKLRTAAGQTILVVLSPVAADIWRLTSAYAPLSQDGQNRRRGE